MPAATHELGRLRNVNPFAGLCPDMMFSRLRLFAVTFLLMACSSASGNRAAAQQADWRQPGARFVASSRGQVYYWAGCDSWKRLNRANLRWFQSAVEAEAAGYRPSQARGCAPQLDTALIAATPGGTARCVVSRIIDGDTFQCDGGSRVRLLIADTDEAGQSIYADSAALMLERMVPVGAGVRLEFDVQVQDRYHRLLAYVHFRDVFVNRELVRHGLAQIEVVPPNMREVEPMRAARDSARAERRGLWSGSAFECTPAHYRRGRCK